MSAVSIYTTILIIGVRSNATAAPLKGTRMRHPPWAVLVTRGSYEAVIHSFPDRGGLFQLFLTTFANFAPAAQDPAVRGAS